MLPLALSQHVYICPFDIVSVKLICMWLTEHIVTQNYKRNFMVTGPNSDFSCKTKARKLFILILTSESYVIIQNCITMICYEDERNVIISIF